MKISSDRLEVIAKQHAKTIADRLSAEDQYNELVNYIKDSFKYPDSSSVDLDALIEDMYLHWETYCSTDKTFSEYLNTFDLTEEEVFIIKTYWTDLEICRTLGILFAD